MIEFLESRTMFQLSTTDPVVIDSNVLLSVAVIAVGVKYLAMEKIDPTGTVALRNAIVGLPLVDVQPTFPIIPPRF